MKVKSKNEVREYYEKYDVVDEYIGKRFTEPLYYFEHKRQVNILNDVIKKSKSESLLELAPGPARVTAEVEAEGGISIDSSENMLKLAKKIMNSIGKKWTFKRGDAFNLKLKDKFDLVFTFRFIFHFKKKDRRKLYLQINKLLRNDGLLVFEALNKKKIAKIREMVGREKYIVYDKAYRKEELIKEINENNFRVIAFYPVVSHFWIQIVISKTCHKLKLDKFAYFLISLLDKIKSKQPYGWVIVCQKK